MKRLSASILTVFLLAIVATCGCITVEMPNNGGGAYQNTPTQPDEPEEYDWDYTEDYSYNIEVITISGVDKVTEINYDKPIKLIVSGVGNTVTVSENTAVTEIVLSGVDNIVYISRSSTPRITQSGVDNEIIRY